MTDRDRLDIGAAINAAARDGADVTTAVRLGYHAIGCSDADLRAVELAWIRDVAVTACTVVYR